MKQAAKFLAVAAAAVSINFWGSPTWAQPGHFGGGGSRNGFQRALVDFATYPFRLLGSGGFRNSFHGGRYYGGFRQHSWGGWGGCGWYPWGFSFVYAPSPYYYAGSYYPTAAYYPPPVAYSTQPAEGYDSPPPPPVAESPQQPVVDRPLSPTAVDRDSPPPPPPRAQRPPQIQRSDQGQSIGVADVKALVAAGLSDEVILSHMRNSPAVYRLTTAEIIDLKTSGVSEKVIDFMINTASGYR
jgi:hypothetical protein